MITGTSNDAALSLPAGLDSHSAGRTSLRIAIAAMCGVAVVSIAVILLGGDMEGAEWKVVLSAIAIAFYSLAGLAAMSSFGREPRWMAPVGLALAGLGLVVWEAYVWFGGPDSDFMLRIAMVAALLSASVTHANLLLADPDRDDPAAGLLAATIVVNGGFTCVLVVGVMIDSFLDGEIFPKVFGVLAVLLGLGTLLVPIMRRIRADEVILGGEVLLPYSPAESAGWLELSYRGQTVVVAIEPEGNDPASSYIRAWTMDGDDERPIPLELAEPVGDAHAVIGRAVQQITRAIDAARS